MKRASLILVFLFAFAFAAVADAKKFRWDAARKIQTGMTIEEVTGLVGKPNTVVASADKIRYVWVYVSPWTFSSRSLVIDFKDGKVIQAPTIPADFK